MTYTRIYTTENTIREANRREGIEGYYEVTYFEYRPDGSLYATGTEDFTSSRKASAIKCYWVYKWDGQKRNKGGHKWWDYEGYFKTNDRKGLMNYLKTRHPEWTEIDLRR